MTAVFIYIALEMIKNHKMKMNHPRPQNTHAHVYIFINKNVCMMLS